MSDIWQRVAERWRRSNVVTDIGASAEAIRAFEGRFRVALPYDVGRYFRLLNGTAEEMDADYYCFWALSKVRPVHEELAAHNGFVYPDRYAYPDCYVFADYLISSWLYAVRLTADSTQSAPVYRVTGSDVPGEQMASSFLEFMSRYAENPDSLL